MNVFRKMFDLYHHSRFLAINVSSHFQHGYQNVFLISPRNFLRRNILFETSFFSLTEKEPKLCRLFKNVSTELSKQDFTRLREKSFPCRELQKRFFLGNGANFFSTFSWTFSSVFSKLRYRFEKNKILKFFFQHVHSLHKTSSSFLAMNLTHVCQNCNLFFLYCGLGIFSDFGKNFGTPVKVPFCLSRKTWLLIELIWFFFILFSHFE